MKYPGLFALSCMTSALLPVAPIHALYVAAFGCAMYLAGAADLARWLKGRKRE